jgi:hypothetical protein
MAAAIVGLAGAALGALITLSGGMFTEERRVRRDEATWRRDKRAEAYDGALRHRPGPAWPGYTTTPSGARTTSYPTG